MIKITLFLQSIKVVFLCQGSTLNKLCNRNSIPKSKLSWIYFSEINPSMNVSYFMNQNFDNIILQKTENESKLLDNEI